MANRDIPYEEALKVFGEPSLVAGLKALTPETDRVVVDGACYQGAVSQRLKAQILAGLTKQLCNGSLIASYRDQTRPLEHHRCDLEAAWWASVDFEFDEFGTLHEVGGTAFPDVRLRKADRPKSKARSQKLAKDRTAASAALDAQPPRSGFFADEDYLNVTLDGVPYALGARQAEVIRKLHEASKTPDPWVHGKLLLRGAGTQRVRDLFKSSRPCAALIKSDRVGKYRLAL